MPPDHPKRSPRQYVARRKWTEAEKRLVVERYPDANTAELAAEIGCTVNQLYDRAEREGVKKNPEFMAAFRARSTAIVRQAGKDKRFRKGHATWNKGIHYDAPGRSAETRFKPRSVPPNYKPVGSERISKDGYLQRKMTATGYPPKDWVPVHHILWRDAGRDIPHGHALVFRDGDKTNLALANLELVTRADLMRRNSVHLLGPEIASTLQLIGALKRQINHRTRSADHAQ